MDEREQERRTGKEGNMAMSRIAGAARRVVNRVVNRPSAVQKRYYLQLRARLDPLRAPEAERIETDRPVLLISGITMQGTGIFCDMLAFLRWVDFADRMGYIPVIDMQNVENLYLEDEWVGKVNAFEYFYRQPAGMTLEEAYRARELYIVNRLDCPYDFTRAQKRCYREVTAVKDWVYGENRARHFERVRALYEKYFVLSEEADAFIKEQHRSLFTPGECTLGLLCRGTDYFSKHPYGHQIQPSVEQIAGKVDELLATCRIDRIFVATEDESILAALRARYAQKIICIDCPRLTTGKGESVAEAFGKKRVDRKMNGLYYFASIALLAQCDHLIAGKTMATQFIRTLRGKPFATEFYWDLGRYGIDEKR